MAIGRPQAMRARRVQVAQKFVADTAGGVSCDRVGSPDGPDAFGTDPDIGWDPSRPARTAGACSRGRVTGASGDAERWMLAGAGPDIGWDPGDPGGPGGPDDSSGDSGGAGRAPGGSDRLSGHDEAGPAESRTGEAGSAGGASDGADLLTVASTGGSSAGADARWIVDSPRRGATASGTTDGAARGISDATTEASSSTGGFHVRSGSGSGPVGDSTASNTSGGTSSADAVTIAGPPSRFSPASVAPEVYSRSGCFRDPTAPAVSAGECRRPWPPPSGTRS